MPQPVSQQFVTNTTDTNSVVEVKYVNGGWLTVANSASLASIDITRGADGQIAYVQDEGLFYKVVKQDEGFDDDLNFLPEIFKWYELPFSGSFSGSFQGDGSQLTGLTAGFPFTGSAQITGSLTVNGPITGSVFSIITGSTEPSYRSGQFYWNSEEETMNLDLTGGVTLQLGQEQHYHVINQSGGTINNGEVVYLAGISSGIISVDKFISDDSIAPGLALGVATEDIGDTETGFVTSFGKVRDVNTNGFSIGDVLWASKDTAGAITNVRPTTPNHGVEIGFVTKVGTTDGELYARIVHKPDAEEVPYNNTISTLEATNVQAALDELDASKASVDLLSSTITIYPTTGSSPVSGYFRMVESIEDADYNDTAVNVATPAISASGQHLASLASDPGVFVGNPGVITVTTLGNIKKVSGNSDATFYFEVYKRESNGTETLITTSSTTSVVTTLTYEQFNASALLNNGSFLATDRIVIKYYGSKVGTATDPIYNFQFGGTNPVKTLFPVPVSVIPTAGGDAIILDTSNFNNILGGSDSTVQAAMDTLDDHSHTLQKITDTGNITTNRIIVDNITADTDTLYTSGSSVGIGTDTLTHTLTINGNGHLTGDFTVTGRVTAEEFHTEFISASILFKSGSTVAGNSLDDIHQFSGSLLVTGEDDHYLTGGNVGIGTSAPRIQLDVAGQAAIGNNTPTLNNNYTAVFGERPAGDYYSNVLMTTTSSLNRGYYLSSYVSASIRNFSITDVLAGNVRMKINQDGKFQLPDYGSGGYTGTTAFGLGVDSSGNLVEIAGGGLKGTGTANRVAYWTAADTIAADNDLYFDGNDLGLGTTSPSAKFEVLKNMNNTGSLGFDGGSSMIIRNENASGSAVLKFIGNDPDSGVIVFGGGTGATTDKFHIMSRYNREERLTVTAQGRVGIGTTSPDAELHVYDPSQWSQIIVEAANDGYDSSVVYVQNGTTKGITGYDDSTNTVAMKYGTFSGDGIDITSVGNVGVGTTTPVAKLEVAYEEFETYSPTSLSATQIAVANRNTTTSGSQVASFHMYATGHKGSTTGVVALNAFQELGNSSTGTFTIQTRNAGSYQERMRIKYDGKVGIGTTNPDALLHVYSTGNGELEVERASGALINLQAQASLGTVGTDSNHPLYLKTNAGTRVAIKTDGNVGIGTTNPATKLEVYNDGITDIRITGNQETDTRIGGVSWYNITGSDVIAAINVDRDGANDAGAITFDTQPADGGNTERMRIDSTGKIKFNAYGSGNNTGTAAYTLRVDSSGRLLEDPIGSGAVDGAALANQVTFWKDSNTVSGSTDVTWNGSTFTINGTLEATEKSFVINHPTKEDKKLVYGVLEGPEHAVYCRGRVTSNEIELPEEWTGLVDEDSITVQLTSIGSHQNLYVSDIKDNKIFIKNGNTFSSKINAFYFVQGTRKDVKPLVTERDK